MNFELIYTDNYDEDNIQRYTYKFSGSLLDYCRALFQTDIWEIASVTVSIATTDTKPDDEEFIYSYTELKNILNRGVKVPGCFFVGYIDGRKVFICVRFDMSMVLITADKSDVEVMIKVGNDSEL